MHAVSRLLESVTQAEGPAAVAGTLVREARAFFRVDRTILLSVAEVEGRVEALAMDPPAESDCRLVALTALPPLATLLGQHEEIRIASGDEAAALAWALGAGEGADHVLLLPMRMGAAVPHVLLLVDRAGEDGSARLLDVDQEEVEVANAFAAAAAAGLAQLEFAAMSAARSARQAALARAARTLSESLELNRVLVKICEEAASILGSDYANVFLGSARNGLRLDATFGLPPELIGARVRTGEGLVGKAIERDEPMLTNDYQALPRQVPLEPFSRVKSSLAVPMHWDGELRGALALGFFKQRLVTREELSLLEAFADLAAAACRNASAHAGLALAARTDGLTGCLNHAAFHDTLRRELERCRRTGHSLSLAVVDLDDFKQVNERHGHLAGDEVLRRVGQALRQNVRPYDLVARYGGDEFAIVAIDSDERTAAEVAGRAIEGVARAVERLDYPQGAGAATAGVAEWSAGDGPTELIARADRALLYGKQQGERGGAVCASELPPDHQLEGSARTKPVADAGDESLFSDRAREQTERLRKRTRQLALAEGLAWRVASLGDAREIAEAAVDELDGAFEYFLTAVLRVRKDSYVESLAARGLALERLGIGHWSQPPESGLIGRALRERRPVVSGDVHAEREYRLEAGMVDVRSELAVPIWVREELWGAIDIEEVRGDAFDDDDARMVQIVAGVIGLALRAAGTR